MQDTQKYFSLMWKFLSSRQLHCALVEIFAAFTHKEGKIFDSTQIVIYEPAELVIGQDINSPYIYIYIYIYIYY